MENSKQLQMNFEDGTIDDYEYEKPTRKCCEHRVRIKLYKREIVSYCSKCGKILAVRRRKEDSK